MEHMEVMDGDCRINNEIQQVSEGQHNCNVINSLLNVDCWHLVLDYLSVTELLRSETTCKSWQKMVLDHIAHRRISVMENGVTGKNRLVLKKSSWPSFKRWVRKHGRSVTDFYLDHCFKDVVEILREYCPNLECLELKGLKRKLSPTSLNHFRKLTMLRFSNCDELTDDCVNQFLTSNLEELRIRFNKRITGRFLNNIKSEHLTVLELKHCRTFKFPYLLSASNRLTNLSKLVFWKRNRSKIKIREQLHLLLNKMLKLNSVSFSVHDLLNKYDVERSLEESNLLFESVCRLRLLNHIDANFEVWDHHLEALARSCDVAAVHLYCDHVTRRGLNSLCRLRGPRLHELSLRKTRITDEDLVSVIYSCPQLGWLDISECPLLVSAVERVAAARRDMRANLPHPPPLGQCRLRLVVKRWDFSGNTDELKDVVEVMYSSDVYSSISRQY